MAKPVHRGAAHIPMTYSDAFIRNLGAPHGMYALSSVSLTTSASCSYLQPSSPTTHTPVRLISGAMLLSVQVTAYMGPKSQRQQGQEYGGEDAAGYIEEQQ
jgi:hypothetical protein